jgi:GNAT superfamily N-acetyltransferase
LTALSRPRPISVEDDCSDFDCGEETLDVWVRTRALRTEKAGASRTFVSVDLDSGTVAGYDCISASSLTHDEATSSLRRNMPGPIPVVLIGRLAVDRRYRRSGLGASLLQKAVRKGVDASRSIGARALVVHAIRDDAERFYRKFGFTLKPHSAPVMYIKMDDAEASITDAAP